MFHSVFFLVWSHSEMESSVTHSVYSFESVETTVIVISCECSGLGIELISTLDKVLPMFALRDTECYELFPYVAMRFLARSLYTTISFS